MTVANRILPSTNAGDPNLVATILTPTTTKATPPHHPLRPTHHHVWHTHAHTHTHTRHTTHGAAEAASRATTPHTAAEVSSHVAHATTKVLVAPEVPTTPSHIPHTTTATSAEAALHATTTSAHTFIFVFHGVGVCPVKQISQYGEYSELYITHLLEGYGKGSLRLS
jgi:hypothetical protein